MKPMTTKRTPAELATIQLRRRNQARIEAMKESMGAAYLLHPDNKGVGWSCLLYTSDAADE